MYSFTHNDIAYLDEAAEARHNETVEQENPLSASEAMRPFRLLVEHMSGIFESLTFAFVQERVTIGRAMDNEVTLSCVRRSR